MQLYKDIRNSIVHNIRIHKTDLTTLYQYTQILCRKSQVIAERLHFIFK